MERIATPARQPRPKWMAATGVLLLVGCFAGWHLASWPVRLAYPGEQNLSEGMPLTEMLHLRQGVSIYAPISPDRFDTANYGPLYYLLGARLLNPADPAYQPMRVASMLGVAACALGCGVLAFWSSRSRMAAILGPLIFLSYAFVHSFGTSVRPDILALALSFGGFLLAYRSQSNLALILSGSLTLLSLFYKQQYVAFPLAVLAYLLIERRTKLAFRYAGIMALGAAALAALFQYVIFPEQAFLHHFLLFNALPFSWHQLGLGVLCFVLVFLVPLLVGLHYLQKYPDKLLHCGLWSAAALGLLTITRSGSDTNYFLECALILSTLFAALIARRLNESTAVAESVVLLGISLFLGQWFSPPPPQPSDFIADRGIQSFLREQFATGTAALGYPVGDLVRAGLEAPISNLFHYTQLIRTGAISDQYLSAQLQHRRFGVIVLHFDLNTEKDDYWLNYYLNPTARQQILANYRLAASLEMPQPEKFRPSDRFFVWVPQFQGER